MSEKETEKDVAARVAMSNPTLRDEDETLEYAREFERDFREWREEHGH